MIILQSCLQNFDILLTYMTILLCRCCCYKYSNKTITAWGFCNIQSKGYQLQSLTSADNTYLKIDWILQITNPNLIIVLLYTKKKIVFAFSLIKSNTKYTQSRLWLIERRILCIFWEKCQAASVDIRTIFKNPDIYWARMFFSGPPV